MSAFIGKDHNNDNIIHMTSVTESIEALKGGLLPSTTFHSQNPYLNVKHISDCYQSSDQNLANFPTYIETPKGYSTKYDIGDTDLLNAITNGDVIIFIIPTKSADGYDMNLSSPYSSVYHYDSNGLYVVSDIDMYYPAPSYIKCIVLENNINNLLSNKLDGDVRISRDGVIIGGVNIMNYSFMTLTSEAPVSADLYFKVFPRDVHLSYYFLGVYNYKTTGNIDCSVKDGNILHNSKHIIGQFSKWFVKLPVCDVFNNATVGGGSGVSLSAYSNVKGLSISLSFTPEYAVFVSLKIVIRRSYGGGSTALDKPFFINGIVKQGAPVYQGWLGGAVSVDGEINSTFVQLVGNVVYVDLFEKVYGSGAQSTNYAEYFIDHTYTTAPVGKVVSLNGSIANILGVGTSYSWLEKNFEAASLPDREEVREGLNNSTNTISRPSAYYNGSSVVPVESVGFGYFSTLSYSDGDYTSTITVNGQNCFLFYDYDEGVRYYKVFVLIN